MGKFNKKITIQEVMPLRSKVKKLEEINKEYKSIIDRLSWERCKLIKEVKELKKEMRR